jgi:hypothetical protein
VGQDRLQILLERLEAKIQVAAVEVEVFLLVLLLVKAVQAAQALSSSSTQSHRLLRLM